MRLQRLDLTRYGHFTDFQLNFAARGKQDFHLIYGPNEAGKSTLFSAFLDLLFGIEAQSPYNFLHDYRVMQVGAALELSSESSAVERQRLKRNRDTWRDGRGEVVGEDELRDALRGLGREAYRTMFSLDDASLQEGGESILRSQGDLGRLLFQATSGLSQLSEQLDGVREEAERFHRPGARSSELRELRAELDALRKDQRAADLNVASYLQLRQASEQAELAYEAAEASRQQEARNLAQLRRQAEAQPLYAQWLALQDAAPPPPAPPEDWVRLLRELSAEQAALQVRQQRAHSDLQAAELALSALPELPPLLAHAEAIEALLAKAPDETEAERLHAARQRLDTALAQLVADFELGETQAVGLRLPPGLVPQLEHLLETQGEVEARRLHAQEELDAARLAEVASRAAAAVTAPLSASALEALHQTWQARPSQAEALRAEEALAQAARETARALAALAPWQGQAAELASQTLPQAARLAAWQTDSLRLGEALPTAREKATRLQHEAEATQRRLQDCRQALGELEPALEAARSARIQAFAGLRQAVAAGAERPALEALLVQLEQALKLEEACLSQREAAAESWARLRHAEGEARACKQAAASATQALAVLEADAEALQAQLDAAAAQLSLPAGWRCAELADWLARRAQALSSLEREAAARQRWQSLDAQEQAQAQRLRETLQQAGVTPLELGDGAVWATQLAQHVTQQRALEAEQATLAARQVEVAQALKLRAEALAQCEARQRAWTQRWDAQLAGSWLQGRPLQLVRRFLAVHAQLAAQLDERQALEARCDALASERAHFEAASRELATLAGLESTAPRELLAGLQQQLEAARRQVAERELLQQQQQLAEQALASASEALEVVVRRVKQLGVRFGVDTLDALEQRCQAAAHWHARAQQAEALAEQLRVSLTAADWAEARASLEVLALAERPPEAELRAAEARLEAQEEAVRRAYLAREQAREAEARESGDAAALQLEEAHRALLETLAERAQRYLRLRLGAEAMERALGLYRERHRSEMMAFASEAFQRITVGAFRDLRTQPGKQGETLVGVTSSGRSLLAAEMSKGTRFQLYLALRIAGYHAFIRERFAVPVIADDIMETFDDARASATFALLAELSKHTQVIYLTHHAHLLPLAEAAAGSTLRIHQLPASR